MSTGVSPHLAVRHRAERERAEVDVRRRGHELARALALHVHVLGAAGLVEAQHGGLLRQV